MLLWLRFRLSGYDSTKVWTSNERWREGKREGSSGEIEREWEWVEDEEEASGESGWREAEGEEAAVGAESRRASDVILSCARLVVSEESMSLAVDIWRVS